MPTLVYGPVLSGFGGALTPVHGMAAHFLATTAAGAFVFFGLIALDAIEFVGENVIGVKHELESRKGCQIPGVGGAEKRQSSLDGLRRPVVRSKSQTRPPILPGWSSRLSPGPFRPTGR